MGPETLVLGVEVAETSWEPLGQTAATLRLWTFRGAGLSGSLGERACRERAGPSRMRGWVVSRSVLRLKKSQVNVALRPMPSQPNQTLPSSPTSPHAPLGSLPLSPRSRCLEVPPQPRSTGGARAPGQSPGAAPARLRARREGPWFRRSPRGAVGKGAGGRAVPSPPGR